MRIGVRFERTGMSRFVSHLDMQRVFSRGIRRTGLPAVYSQGFNPHIILSFAQALAVGLETTGDYMEFSVKDECEAGNIKEKLAKVMPPDIKITAVGKLEEKGKKLMAAVEAAEYDITFEDESAAEAIDAFMKESSHMLKNRKGTELDARKLVFSAETGKNSAKMMLSLSSAASLSPYTLMEELIPGKKFSVLRKDLFTSIDGKLVSLSGLFTEEL